MSADRILVVDDEPGVRVALEGILADEGYDVTAVETGEAGVELLRKESFDAVHRIQFVRPSFLEAPRVPIAPEAHIFVEHDQGLVQAPPQVEGQALVVQPPQVAGEVLQGFQGDPGLGPFWDDPSDEIDPFTLLAQGEMRADDWELFGDPSHLGQIRPSAAQDLHADEFEDPFEHGFIMG